MARRHSRSSGRNKMPGGMIAIVGLVAIGLAVYGIWKGKKNQEGASAAPAIAYGPFQYPAIGSYHPFAGQLSGMGIGGQQEVGVEPKILKYLMPSQFSNEIGYTLKNSRPLDNWNYGSAVTVSAKGAGSRLAMHGDPSYSGLPRNTTIYHGIPHPDPVRIKKVTIAGGPGAGNDYTGGLAVGYHP